MRQGHCSEVRHRGVQGSSPRNDQSAHREAISAKTVKDSDLSGLKTLFGWAVSNRKLTSNPVTGITIKARQAGPTARQGVHR